MRIEYLTAIAIAAVAAGTGLAVHSVGSLPPEKQSTPAAAQLALAESVDPFLFRSGRLVAGQLKTHWRCLSYGDRAPSAERSARRIHGPARRYLAPHPARNAAMSLSHIPWRSHPYVRSSSVGLNARIVPLLLPTPQLPVRYFWYWHVSDMPQCPT